MSEGPISVQAVKTRILNHDAAITEIEPILNDSTKLWREDGAVSPQKECWAATEARKSHGQRIVAWNPMLIEIGRIDLAHELVVTDFVN